MEGSMSHLKNMADLQSDLKSFGLNPIDWKILKEKSQVYRVQSKTDQTFAFIGDVGRKGRHMKWRKLALLSL